MSGPITPENQPPGAGDASKALSGSDWSPFLGSGARWIARPGPDTDPAPVFHAAFRLDGPPASATLAVAGLGLHSVRLNGAAPAPGALEPAISDARRVVWYSVLPVAGLLTAGPNELEITLGRGFYDMATPDGWRWEQAPWRDRRRLIAELAADGRPILVSGPGWRVGDGPVRLDSMYEGETYDARAAAAGRAADTSVELVAGPGGRLEERHHEPVRPQPPIEPSWRRSRHGWLGDAGAMIAGVARYDLHLAEGRTVTARFGEKLDGAGELVCENEHTYTGRFQTDEIIGAGGRVSWQPEFSYKGFRYIEVRGLGRRPGPGEILAVPLVQQVRSAATFDCDVDLLNDLVAMMGRTVLNNLHHIPTDTPTYEKNGWTGDVLVSLDSLSALFDLHLLLAKWAEDVVSTQRPDGSLAVIAPSPGWGYASGECAPAPEWTCVLPALLKHLADVYDDAGPAHVHWGACRAYLDHELARMVDGLATSELGDYLSPGYPLGPPPEDSRLSASCFLFRALGQGAGLARMNDDADSAVRYLAAAQQLRARINDTFLDAEAGCYRTADDPVDETGREYRQTSNLMPVAFGVVPEAERARVVASIVADVRRRNHHLNTGHIGTSLLLDVLTDEGFAADALAVATATDCPSWGYWAGLGATTMWERWDAGARSRDHFFMGTVADWVLTRVAGVRRTGPGWSRARITPGLVPGVDRAAIGRRTPLGTLQVEWVRGQVVHVDVPQGMECELDAGGSLTTLGPGRATRRL